MRTKITHLLRGCARPAAAAVLALAASGWWLAELGPALAHALSIDPAALLPQRDLPGPPAGAVPPCGRG